MVNRVSSYVPKNGVGVGSKYDMFILLLVSHFGFDVDISVRIVYLLDIAYLLLLFLTTRFRF